MSAPNISRWIGIGLLGLPLYGALTFWSSLNPQPDPGTRYEAWARYVTTDHYVVGHLFGSILGLILAIFGTFALGAYLATSRAGRMGLVAMVLTVLGSALFLPAMGVSTFAVPEEGQAYLAGIEEYRDLPDVFADTVFALTSLVVILLIFSGNLLLGVAVWRSGTLPKGAGALWAAAAVFMYPMGLVYAAVILGVQSTPRTVLIGALLIVASGGVDVPERPAPALRRGCGDGPAEGAMTSAWRTPEDSTPHRSCEVGCGSFGEFPRAVGLNCRGRRALPHGASAS